MESSDLLIDAYGRIRELVQASAQGLGTDGLTYRPEPGANSIAWLVWHLTRIQDDHVSEIAGRTQAWVEGPWAEQLGRAADAHETGFGHTAEQVASLRPGSAEPLLAYHAAVAGRTVDYLATVTAAELDRVIDDNYDPPVTVGVRLVSVVSDNLQHAGQARYLRGIVDRLGRA
ncbi:DinB family protein [Flindersiella endophytica]